MMNLKLSKATLYKGFVIVCLFFALLTIYYSLGGFKTIEVSTISSSQRLVYGKFFKHAETEEYYDHGILCRKLIDKGLAEGILIEVLYLTDSTENKEGGRFLGVSLKKSNGADFEGFEKREFGPATGFSVRLDMNPMVMPGPEKVESLIYQKAIEKNKALKDFIFTSIYPDNVRVVEWWFE